MFNEYQNLSRQSCDASYPNKSKSYFSQLITLSLTAQKRFDMAMRYLNKQNGFNKPKLFKFMVHVHRDYTL